jgi:hypothetical protein
VIDYQEFLDTIEEYRFRSALRRRGGDDGAAAILAKRSLVLRQGADGNEADEDAGSTDSFDSDYLRHRCGSTPGRRERAEKVRAG